MKFEKQSDRDQFINPPWGFKIQLNKKKSIDYIWFTSQLTFKKGTSSCKI